MIEAWTTAVEDAADVLGEMLMAVAEGEASHTHEDMAAAVLRAGIERLLTSGPAQERIASAARVLYAMVHGEDRAWPSLPTSQKAFWLEAAGAALRAADEAQLKAIER
jgi:hypothetical protein